MFNLCIKEHQSICQINKESFWKLDWKTLARSFSSWHRDEIKVFASDISPTAFLFKMLWLTRIWGGNLKEIDTELNLVENEFICILILQPLAFIKKIMKIKNQTLSFTNRKKKTLLVIAMHPVYSHIFYFSDRAACPAL